MGQVILYYYISHLAIIQMSGTLMTVHRPWLFPHLQSSLIVSTSSFILLNIISLPSHAGIGTIIDLNSFVVYILFPLCIASISRVNTCALLSYWFLHGNHLLIISQTSFLVQGVDTRTKNIDYKNLC